MHEEDTKFGLIGQIEKCLQNVISHLGRDVVLLRSYLSLALLVSANNELMVLTFFCCPERISRCLVSCFDEESHGTMSHG